MNPKPFHLQISAKPQFFNFFRRFFIVCGVDKILPVFTIHSSTNTLATKHLYQITNASTVSLVDENTNFTNCHIDTLCTPALTKN